jgi:post-segregation antitoxin (ccd killing protein)
VSGSRTSVYLDDDLLAAAKSLDLNISGVLQTALREAVEQHIALMRQAVLEGQAAQRRLDELNGVAVLASEAE